MADFDTFINSIIADGNDGKAFEVFCKHFLQTSPEYRDQFEKVWLWDECPPMIPIQWGFEDKIGETLIDVSTKRRNYIRYHNRYVFNK